MEGVRQLGRRMIEMGHSVEVLSLDDRESDFVSNFSIPVHAIGPSYGSYRYNSTLVPWLLERALKYDAIVVDGLWQYHSFGAWRALHKIGKPYYVFTHGMLDPWFKKAYPLKHLKKWLYWPWAEYRVLRDAKAVLFTAEDERILAPQSFWLYRANGVVVPYGTKAPPQNKEFLREEFLKGLPELRDKRVFLFLSRIQEKKGCDILIQAFSEVAAQYPELHLVMAGPGRPEFIAELKGIATRTGIANRITWTGMLQGDVKWGAFYASEAFVLPSHQENFGIAVVEALGCGLPVIISNKINIWREIEVGCAGMVSDDCVSGTKSSLVKWLKLDGAEKKEYRKNAFRLFHSGFSIDTTAEIMIRVLGG